MKALEEELSGEERASQLPQHLRQKITDEILQRLRSLNSSGTNATQKITMEQGECMPVILLMRMYYIHLSEP